MMLMSPLQHAAEELSDLADYPEHAQDAEWYRRKREADAVVHGYCPKCGGDRTHVGGIHPDCTEGVRRRPFDGVAVCELPPRAALHERDARITDLEERKDFFKKSAVAADDMLIQRDAEIERLKARLKGLEKYDGPTLEGVLSFEAGLDTGKAECADQLRIAREALVAARVGISTIDSIVARIISCLGISWKKYPDAKLDADKAIDDYEKARRAALEKIGDAG